MNVFIDANIFLSFFHLSSEDLEELRKALVLHQNQKIIIWLPDQVRDEFVRNRQVKIADALRRFDGEKLNNPIPQMMRGYEEFARLTAASKAFNDAKNKIREKLILEVKAKSLKADKIVKAIFSKASKIKVTQTRFLKAKFRADSGNPPGKVGSYGDAINWECLVAAIPEGEDLHIISEDRDYFSSLDGEEPNEFLANEWALNKKSKLSIYRKLSKFLPTHFPDAKLASELEKECAIADLAASSNFARTHSIVAKLAGYAEFTKTQVDEILDAFLTNSQISWIISDDDVSKFARRILANYGSIADPERAKKVKELLPEKEEEIEF